jgi:hypothetical protein
MTADDLLKALYGVAIAALGIVSIVLGVVARYVPDMIRTFLEGKKLISLERAGNISARAAEEHGRSESWNGTAKQAAAQELVRSIAPNAAAKIGVRELTDVVKAGVQQMRASVPTSFAPPPIDILRPPKVPGDIS